MRKILFTACFCAFAITSQAQSKLYPEHFDLQEVTLYDSPLKRARDINSEHLLKYDVDRLLTPLIRQAGLNSGRYEGWTKKHPSFKNWGLDDWSLEGHVIGHYLTAVALAYAANHDNPAMQAKMMDKVRYIVDVMKDCQDAYNDNTEGLKGFIGGQPINQIWTGLYKNDLTEFRKYGYWVPFYCEHKILAGLRDAYVYAGDKTALDCFIKMCDWAGLVISNLSEHDMQSVLGYEHGGMNEVVADAYALTGDKKYLDIAMRYNHQQMVDGMQQDYSKFLNGKHANTQVPKYIGFERIGSLTPNPSPTGEGSNYLLRAADHFYFDVLVNRTTCIGGNSISEHFLPMERSNDYINNPEGPESCNTNNMMKLSEMMFDRCHSPEMLDFYEYAMWNHILSTQDPVTGGYVYFTSLRPQSYRIYSQPNMGMWCCVGTGMENHSKYGHFTYTHSEDNKTLYVNLFMPSELNSKHFGIKQETEFPYSDKVKLTVTKGGKYTIVLRKPNWTTEDYSIKVNGKNHIIGHNKTSESWLVPIDRKWKKGDVIELSLPFATKQVECIGKPDYVAFTHGPILLAAKLPGDTPNEYAKDERMGHSLGAFGVSLPLSSAPMIIGEDHKDWQKYLTHIDTRTLTARLSVTRGSDVQENGTAAPKVLILEPFYGIHHARYSCYFYSATPNEYANSSMGKRDAEEQALNARTVDYVATGEQQSEAGHAAQYTAGSTYGHYRNETYRDAKAGDYIQYTLETKGLTEGATLMLRHITSDRGRKYELTVDDKHLANLFMKDNGCELDAEGSTVTAPDDLGFINIEIPVPAAMLEGKQSIDVRLTGNQNTMIPGLYYLRLMK